jgi:hypothetical protein
MNGGQTFGLISSRKSWLDFASKLAEGIESDKAFFLLFNQS